MSIWGDGEAGGFAPKTANSCPVNGTTSYNSEISLLGFRSSAGLLKYSNNLVSFKIIFSHGNLQKGTVNIHVDP